MKDQDCTRFLQWALPRLRMRWPGFRKVRGQVCKRIGARMRALGLTDISSYRTYLEQRPDEWHLLDSLCRITISRFYRDKEVFQLLEQEVIPQLVLMAIRRGDKELRCWSIGCASGEEPYTLAVLWDAALRKKFPDITIKIVATDADRKMIERAQEGCFSAGSLRELPKDRLAGAFIRSGARQCIRDGLKEPVEFLRQDIRTTMAPDGPFHLVLCRNIVFTYFDEDMQREVIGHIRTKLLPGGALVTGIHESLPPGTEGIDAWSQHRSVYRVRENRQRPVR